jgi:hypothetical protein
MPEIPAHILEQTILCILQFTDINQGNKIMRCKICGNTTKITSSAQRKTHHWQKRNCAKCHYLGQIRAYPIIFKKKNTYAKTYWKTKKLEAILIESM